MAHKINYKGKELRIHESLDEVGNDLAEYISELSDTSVKDRGVFSLAFSGASLIALMGKLCETPYNKTIEWSKWHIFLADESVVPKNHSDSNYKLTKDTFLSKVPIIPSHVHSINDTVTGEEAAGEYEFLIRQSVKSRVIRASGESDCPKFDLVLLGVGPDGHVASLLPNRTAAPNNEWVAFVPDAPKGPPERITLTLPVINSASNVAVVAVGPAVAEAVSSALGRCSSSSVPASLVLPANGELVWFLDKLAASKLDYDL